MLLPVSYVLPAQVTWKRLLTTSRMVSISTQPIRWEPPPPLLTWVIWCVSVEPLSKISGLVAVVYHWWFLWSSRCRFSESQHPGNPSVNHLTGFQYSSSAKLSLMQGFKEIFSSKRGKNGVLGVTLNNLAWDKNGRSGAYSRTSTFQRQCLFMECFKCYCWDIKLLSNVFRLI